MDQIFEVNGNRGGRWGWAPRQRLTAAEVIDKEQDPEALVRLSILNKLGGPVAVEDVDKKRPQKNISAVHTPTPAAVQTDV